MVKLGRIHIKALVDTGASATVINENTFAQVPDKDKIRLDMYVEDGAIWLRSNIKRKMM